MFGRIAIINTSVLSVVCISNPTFAQPQKMMENSKTSVKSSPIGRLLSGGDRNKKKGSLIFPGDRLDPTGETVKVLCYLNRKVLKLGKGKVDDDPNKCVKPPIEINKCDATSRNYCPKPKITRENAQKPIVLVPYSYIVLSLRPSISWYRVQGADNYIVFLKGRGSNWSKKTKTNTLLYPNQSAPMQFGNVYNLSVIAKKGNVPLTASSTILVVLSKSEAQLIQASVTQIRNLKLSPDQEARDLQTVFRSKHLLTQAIQVLKKRIDAGTNNPTLHRLLGDCYLEARFPEKAKSLYTNAFKLAQKANNPTEQAMAQTGINRAHNSLKQHNIND